MPGGGRLRAEKATGGYADRAAPRGVWVTYEPGEVLRCPAPTCGKAFMKVAANSLGVVRINDGGPEEPRGVGGEHTCRNRACGAIIEVRFFPTT